MDYIYTPHRHAWTSIFITDIVGCIPAYWHRRTLVTFKRIHELRQQGWLDADDVRACIKRAIADVMPHIIITFNRECDIDTFNSYDVVYQAETIANLRNDVAMSLRYALMKHW